MNDGLNMSRSFHTTRKDVQQAYEKARSGDDSRIQEYRKLYEEYLTKRRAKSHIKEERQYGQSVHGGFSIDTLPIEAEERSEYLHFPVSEQDIRTLLKRMPQGLIDGLDKITFTLGKFEQRCHEEPYYTEPEKDPYLGRLGHEVFGGIYRPSCLGTYFLNINEIKLYGYTYDPAIENRDLWDLYLRLHMLGVFVHELAHHYDFVNRISRGRWRMDDVEKGEIYAETVAYKWIKEYVIPYVKEVYAEQWRLLENWMQEKVGVVLPTSLLIGDCRAKGKKGRIRITSFFSTSTTFEEFVQNVLSGKDLEASKVEIADGLHMAEEYEIALEILNPILEKDRKNIDAICLYGEICDHLEDYHEAIKYAKMALQIDSQAIEAFQVLCDAYRGLNNWKAVIKWASRGLAVTENGWKYSFFLTDKIRAEMELNILADAQKTWSEFIDFYEGRKMPKRIQQIGLELEKKLGE